MRPSASLGCRGQAPPMRLLNPTTVVLEWDQGQRDRTIGRPLRQLGADGCWITSSARSSSDGGIVRAQPRHGQSYQ